MPSRVENPAHTGIVRAVEPESLADELGLTPGDRLFMVNGHPVEDVIDVQFHAAEDWVELRWWRGQEELMAEGERESGQPLGIEFEHPTFDIDIRRCNNLCPFCFVLQTGPRMRRTLYIKDDDYRYSFLYGHFVTLTNLSERDWQRIQEQHLSPLYVSVHATEPEVRRKCLSNRRAPDIMKQLRWLAERGIEVHTQLVVTPGLNDGPHVERSVRDLASLVPNVRSVSVVPVGLTKHHKYGHRAHTRKEAEVMIRQVEAWQREFRKRFKAGFVYLTDEWYLVAGRDVPALAEYDGLDLEENGLGMIRKFLDDWEALQPELKRRRRLKAHGGTLVTGALFESTLAQTVTEFNRLARTELHVAGVRNERLGHGITVAGLLMGRDVIDQLTGRDLGEVVVLPRIMFDHPQGISLDDVSPLTIAKALDRPLYLADAMGDVLDALTGKNPLRIDPAEDVIPLEVMKAGGWAVEKYL